MSEKEVRADYDRIAKKIAREDPDISHDLQVVRTYIAMAAEAMDDLEEKLTRMFEAQDA